MTIETKLAVLLHADVVESTRLVQLDERIAHERIHDAFQRFAALISGSGGTLHELRGDALVAEFARASDAVTSALSFQFENVADDGESLKEMRPALRVGIAIGEVVVAHGTVTGVGVVLAQRVEQLAKPGGVCVTAAVAEAIPERLGIQLQPLGQQDLKGFDRPTQVYAAAGPMTRDHGPSEQPLEGVTISDTEVREVRRPTIAVLPFRNLSGDREQELFADGLAEDIITDLSRFRWLSVIARNSSFTFKGQSIDDTQIADLLDARYLLQGSIRRSGDRIRVAVELSDTASREQIWAERYDRDLSEIFEIQDEVTLAIVTAVAPELDLAERQRGRQSTPGTINAWCLYQNGLARFYEEQIELAIEAFNSVTQIDDTFPPAWAMLAIAKSRAARDDPNDLAARLAEARECARTAVRLDPRDPHCLHADGYVHILQGESDLAITRLTEALALNPNYAQARFALAYALSTIGRHEEAIDAAAEALRLSPRDPDVTRFHNARAFSLCLLERFEEAEEAARHSINCPDPTIWAFVNHAIALHQLGRHEAAASALADARARKPELTRAQFRRSFQHYEPNSIDKAERYLEALGLPE